MRKKPKKTDLQVLNEARHIAGLNPRLDMPDRDHKVWPSIARPDFTRKTAQKVSRKNFPNPVQVRGS